MQVCISGSTGLVGTRLNPALEARGDEVRRLVRGSGDGIHWDPTAGEIDGDALIGIDAVVHLAGESIAEGRWTAAKKARIRDSRIDGTKLISETLAGLEKKPATLVCASATGFYGDRGDEECDENSPAGTGFLAEVCQGWEEATKAASDAGIRVVNLRIGVVLSKDGGALSKMLLPFRLGGGGVVGSGKQYWSWIAIDDLVSAIVHCLTTESLSGPVNAVSPEPATNREFTKALGAVLNRPTLIPMPAFAARLALGELADALLLPSTRVRPGRLTESGFSFAFPELVPALRHVIQ